MSEFSEIKVNGHYKATVMGYNTKDTVFVQLANKYTAYLDVSEYYLSEEDVHKNFRVNKQYEVIVTKIDKNEWISCRLAHPIEVTRTSTMKTPKHKDTKEDVDTLTYNLESVLAEIELEEE